MANGDITVMWPSDRVKGISIEIDNGEVYWLESQGEFNRRKLPANEAKLLFTGKEFYELLCIAVDKKLGIKDNK